MNGDFRKWVARLFQTRTAARAADRRTPRWAPVFRIESLEDRVVPAGTITIIESGVGTLDGFLGPTDGTLAAADGGAADGTLSRAALQAVNAATPVSITAQNSIIFEAALTTPVALQQGAGVLNQFISQNGSIQFASQSDGLTTAGASLTLQAFDQLSLGALATAGGNIRLIGDRMDLGSAINAGAGRVSIQSNTAAYVIDLGGPDVIGSRLGLFNTELSQITASIVQVGNSLNTGGIVVSAPITQTPGVTALDLETGNTGVAVSQTGTGAILVDSLAVRAVGSVLLSGPPNDVENLAVSVTGAGSDFVLVDTDSVLITAVDGLAGVAVNDQIVLSTGGILSQAVGANVTGNGLDLIGTGPVILTNAGNDVTTLAANLTSNNTGTLSYTDANALNVGAAGVTTGVTTNNSDVTITTVNGPLVVTDANGTAAADVDAGTAVVRLTAGSINTDNILALNANAGVTGTGGVVFTADRMNVGAAVNAGANTAVLRNVEGTTPIELGTVADPSNTLALSDPELDFVTAGVIVVGRNDGANAAGNITVTSAVGPANTSQLELVTGAGIVDGSAGLDDITVTRLGLTAGTGIGVAGGDIRLDIIVSNVEATTDTGGIQLANQGGPVTIGGVNATLTGLDVTTAGSLVFTNVDTITVGATAAEGVTVNGGGSIDVSNTSNNINVNAPVAATGGDGDVTINAEDNVNLGAAVSAAGAGDITIIAEPTLGNAGSLASTAAGTVTAQTGNIRLQAMDNVNLAGAVAVTAGTGTITVIAELTTGPSAAAGNFSNSGTGTLTTAGGDISVQAGDGITVGAAISAGGAGNVSLLADAAIDTIGDVTNSAPISTVSGSISAQGVNVTLNPGGTVTSTAGGDITLKAESGNGGNATVDAAVSTSGGNGNIVIDADFSVAVNAPVSATGTGRISVAGDFDNNGSGDITTSAAGTLSTTGGLIRVGALPATLGVAQNVTVNGAITVTGGAGSAVVLADDNVIVNAPISVTGTGAISLASDVDNSGVGDITTTAAGSLTTAGGLISVGISSGGTSQVVTIGAPVTINGGGGAISVSAENGVTINAPLAVAAGGTGGITVLADVGDNGTGDITSSAAGAISTSGGAINIGGLLPTLAEAVTLNGPVTVTGGAGDIVVAADGTVTTTAPLTVTGTGGITIRADEDNSGAGDIIAAALSTAGGSIVLGGNAPAQAQNVTLTGATTVTGGAGVVLAQAENDVTVNAPVTVTGTGGITMAADTAGSGGGVYTSSAAGDLSTQGANILVTAADVIALGDFNTHNTTTSRVEFHASTAAAVIHLGANTAFGLSNAELNLATAGVLQVGDTGNTGGISLDGAVTLAPAQVPTLSLQTDGAVTDNTVGEQPDVTVRNLAVRAQDGIGAGGRGAAADIDVAVTNLAVSNTNNGAGAAAGDVNVFNTGALTIAQNIVGGTLGSGIDGLSGATNGAGGGNLTIGTGSPMTIDSAVLDSGGGDIDLFTTGANGDLTVTANGSVTASGGNGNILLDTSAATSGGTITVNNNNGLTAEVLAAGSGTITFDAASAVAINLAAVVQTATGDVTIRSNSNTANTNQVNNTADVTMAALTRILTSGSVFVDTDPDGNFIGGSFTMDPTAQITSSNSLGATAVFINAGNDATVSGITTLAASGTIDVRADGNVLDDGVDTTELRANVITLRGGGRIGGTNPILPGDVLSADPADATPTTGRFLSAVDFQLTGATPVIRLGQTNIGGNIQIRSSVPLATSSVSFTPPAVAPFGNAVVGPTNQLAIIATGNLTVDTAFSPPTNVDTTLATTGGGDVLFVGPLASVSNGTPGASTTVLATGSTTADVVAPAVGDNVPEISGTRVVLGTTGGLIGNSAATPLEIQADRLDGFSNGNGTTGGNVFLADTANGIAVGQFNAGTGTTAANSNVTLVSRGNNGATSNITAVSPNDNTPEIVGNVITLDTTGAPAIAGPNGQIGLPGTFFEVNANVISAATNNSSLWLSEVGTGGTAGAAIGSVTAGTGTAFLRVRNGGTLTSQSVNFAPDVVAATVNLSTVAGEAGNFGTSVSSPLEIDATTLTANAAGTGGNLFVRDTAGGLTVARATTTVGNVGIEAVGGALVLGTPPAGVPSVVAASGTVALVSGGAISSTAPAGVTDVTAAALIVSTGAAVGSAGTPLETAVGTLASLSSGGIVVSNTGNLVVGPVTLGSLSNTGVVALSGPVDLTAAGSLTVVGGVTGVSGGVTLTAVDAAGTGQDVVVNPGVTVASNTGAVVLRAGDLVTLGTGSLVAAAGAVTLDVGFNDLDGVGGAVIRGTIDSTAGTVAAVGGAGADTVLVDFTGGAALPDGLSFTGGGAADELQVSDAAGTATHNYIISAAGVVRDGGPALTFAADVESVDVTGGNLADAFTVTATAATAVRVHGGAPTAAPGDTLAVNGATTAFLTTTGTGSVSGTYDFPAGTQDVTFDNIESLNTGADAVSVTKTDGITNAIPGTTVTYTVVVTNNATVGLTGIRVQDVVPAALTGVSFTAVFAGTGSTGNAGPVAGNSIDQTITLAAGGTATYTITGTLAPTTPAGTGTLANTVTVTPPAGVTDSPGNNTATDTDNVVPTGDVTVTKTNGTTTTVPGTTTTYTIVVSNSGPSTVSLTLADVFPAAIVGATYTAANGGGATGGTAGSGNINQTLTLPAGGSVTYTASAPVSGSATGTLANTATATILTPGFSQGANAGPDSATDTDTLTPQGDVVVTKTDGTTTVTAGTTTTYTIAVTNTGPSTVTVPFADTLPAQITSATRTVVNGGGATGGTAGAGNIADTLTLPAGGTVTYTVTATIDPAAPAGTLTNTATATVPAGFDQGGNTANDSATDTDTLVAAPDLAVMAASPATAKVGTPFTYTFTVRNAGASTQTNVVLTHTLPTKAINTSASSTQGTVTIGNGVVTATIGTLAPGAVATVTVTLNPTDDGAFALAATATGAIAEPNTANNTATATTQVAPYQPLIVAGPGAGGGAEVRVLNADTGALEARFIPFGPFFNGSMSVAQGDVNGDGVPEIIVGAGPGGAARVSVFDVRTGATLMNFFAFEPSVTGGVNVGAGDLDGDGKDEVLTGAGAGFGPRVRAFDSTGKEVRSFFAYETSFTGGVRVAAGDTNGDGRVDIITGAGGGGSARVQVFDGTTLAVLQNFFAYSSGLRDGVYVAAADTNGDGIAEIVTGAGGGGASHIKLFDGKTLAEKASFFAFAPTARDGVTVGATDRNSDGIDDITAGTGVGVQAQVKEFSGSGAEEAVYNAFDIGFVNGVYVG